MLLCLHVGNQAAPRLVGMELIVIVIVNVPLCKAISRKPPLISDSTAMFTFAPCCSDRSSAHTHTCVHVCLPFPVASNS